MIAPVSKGLHNNDGAGESCHVLSPVPGRNKAYKILVMTSQERGLQRDQEIGLVHM